MRLLFFFIFYIFSITANANVQADDKASAFRALDWHVGPQIENIASKATIKTNKTKKTTAFTVMVPATDKHPAQIEKWAEDVVVGIYTLEKTSGMISPSHKSKLLSRVDNILQECKKARMRANCAEACTDKVASYLFDYIMK